MKRVPLLVLLFAMCMAFSPPASAATFTLTDFNSTATVDPSSQAGMSAWSIDGIQVLSQQWFWYRVGSGAEQSIDTLTLSNAVQPTSNTLFLTYTGTGFNLTVLYAMLGGQPGSRTADIAETIRVNNTSGAALDFHFFQYSDFDLSSADSLVIDHTLGKVNQNPAAGGSMVSETVITPAPNHGEAAGFGATLGSLNDGGPTTLSDSLSATGDVTWALQWDANIAPGGSLLISKDKNVASVPEPATVGLLGGAILLLASKLRKRSV